MGIGQDGKGSGKVAKIRLNCKSYYDIQGHAISGLGRSGGTWATVHSVYKDKMAYECITLDPEIADLRDILYTRQEEKCHI